MNRDHHVLWELSKGESTTACVMVSCCGGAELQVLRLSGSGDEQIVLRELYPDRDSLYERARALRSEMPLSPLEMIPAIAKDLLVPGTIPFLVGLACGTLLLYRRKDGGRAGRLILTVLLLFYWVFSTPVLAVPIIHALTPSSPPVETVAQAGGATAIVVLGAGMDVYHSRGQMFEASPREDALRILEAARVYRVLDNPWVIATGGFANGRYTEAARMAEELRALDVPADRIVIEGRAQNTHQHAIYVPPLLRERKVSRFVLVTSRQHMARAMRVFRKAGWDPVPSSPEVFADRLQPIEKCLPSKNMLVASQQLFYDAGGMIYYRLRGWI